MEWTSSGKPRDDAIFFSFNSYSLWSKKPEIELPLKNSAMTQFFLQILVFCSEVAQTLVPNADQVAPALKVSHFDSSSMTETSLYAINQVRPCHFTPEELEVSKATITFYSKHFREELNATKCRIQHQREKWHCGHNDHSSIDHTIAGITSDLTISPEHCRTLAKGANIILQGHWIGAEWDTKTPLLWLLVIPRVQTGIIAKQEAGFLEIPSLSTCKNQL